MANKLLTILVIISLCFVIIISITYLVPWYKQKLPLEIIGNTFKPGDHVPIKVERKSLINLNARIVRELIRLDKHNNIEFEVSKEFQNVDFGIGKKTVVIYYKLPTLLTCPQLKSNTYIYRGNITYKPLGLIERRFHFETEEFQINIHGKENLHN